MRMVETFRKPGIVPTCDADLELRPFFSFPFFQQVTDIAVRLS